MNAISIIPPVQRNNTVTLCDIFFLPVLVALLSWTSERDNPAHAEGTTDALE